MNKVIEQQKLGALVDWYLLAGIDCTISDAPTDSFALSAQAAVRALAPSSAPAPRRDSPGGFAPMAAGRPAPAARQSAPQAQANRNLAGSSTAQAVLDARKLAREADNLDALKQAVAGFDGCALKQMAKNMCFADGSQQARLMFIGEAPGRDEDLSGTPFVGRAGQLFNLMLAAIELQREQDVWITNTVYWRPPGNRTPSQEETEICRPFLDRQIELLQPQIIVALGGAAAKHMLQTTSGIMRLRGKWREIEIAGKGYPLLPTLHPAYLLRTPSAKKLAWRDLLAIKQRLAP